MLLVDLFTQNRSTPAHIDISIIDDQQEMHIEKWSSMMLSDSYQVKSTIYWEYTLICITEPPTSNSNIQKSRSRPNPGARDPEPQLDLLLGKPRSPGGSLLLFGQPGNLVSRLGGCDAASLLLQRSLPVLLPILQPRLPQLEGYKVDQLTQGQYTATQ